MNNMNNIRGKSDGFHRVIWFKGIKEKNSDLKNLFIHRWKKQSWSIPSDLKWSFLEREALNKQRIFSILFYYLKVCRR